MTTANGRSSLTNTDNLQASVESWITNIDSLEIYSLNKVLCSVPNAPLKNINLNRLYNCETSTINSDLVVKRHATSGEFLDFYEVMIAFIKVFLSYFAHLLINKGVQSYYR